MRYLYLILAIIVFIYVAVKLTRYEERMIEYNYHICVETYGLNENCQERSK